MRRWLPIALLIAAAGLAALGLRWRSTRLEPVAAESAPAPSAPAALDPALQSDPVPSRTTLAPAPATSADPASSASKPDPSLGHLTVHVVGTLSRGPVANVRVQLSPMAGADTAIAPQASSGNRGDLEHPPITGADGVVTFDLPPAVELRLYARSEDGLSGDAGDAIPALRAGEQRELVLEIPDGVDGRVVGRVVCAETREPVAGARVRWLRGGQVRTEWHTPGPDERTTGNDGIFELPFPTWSDPRLCVEAAGYGLRYANLDTVHTDLAHALLVHVSRAATLDARVLDSAGAPIPGVWVELSTRGYLLARHEADEAGFFGMGVSFSFPPDEHWRAQTGADGRASLSGLAPRVELRAEVSDGTKPLYREPTGLRLQPGEVKELTWRIGAGTLVRGLALDQDGKPVANLEIWALRSASSSGRYLQYFERERVDRTTRSDGDGRFTLEDLAAGRWAVGPGVEDGGIVAPIAQLLEISGEPVVELTLNVFRGQFIRGRVLTPSGEPATNAWVNGFNSSSDRPEGVRTGSDGSFAFGPVGPEPITLTADALARFASSDPVQASAGDTGVVLQLKQGGAIRGRVVDGVSGLPCSAQVLFVPEQPLTGLFANGLQTTTSPDGSFGAAGLIPGRWSVSASTGDGKFAQQAHIEVAAGSDSGELVLPLSPGAKLRLRYQGAQPWVFVTVTRDGPAVLMQAPVESGKPKEFMVPAGALVLEIRNEATGPARTKVVELKVGETKEIALTDEN